jgi:adenosylhomocysteine nucleosidase
MTRSDDPQRHTVTNQSWGTVGIQAGTVTGSTVSMHTAAPDLTSVDELAAAVADLRVQLDRDRAARKVDDDTYEAAQDELEAAETALRSPAASEQKKSLLALKRLGGLVSGATDLATKIAGLVAAAGRLF